MRKSVKRIVVNLIRVAATLILAELIAAAWVELALRKQDPRMWGDITFFSVQKGRAEEHPYLNFVPLPGFRYRDTPQDKPLHNSLGFRGDEFAEKKPAGTFRILMLGGSAIYGTSIANNAYTIPAQLETTLRKRGYAQVEVINGGVFAYSTAESLIELQFRALELSPDLVILVEGINDLHNRYVPPGQFHADNRGSVKRWEGFRSPFYMRFYLPRLFARRFGYLPRYFNFDYMIRPESHLGHTHVNQATESTDYKALLRENTPVFFRENLLSILAICKIRGIRLVIGDEGFTQTQNFGGFLREREYLPGLAEMNRVAREFSLERHLPFLDFQERMPQNASFWDDELHVNNAGAVKAGEIWANFLEQERLLPQPARVHQGR